jgi:hypothetical protein
MDVIKKTTDNKFSMITVFMWTHCYTVFSVVIAVRANRRYVYPARKSPVFGSPKRQFLQVLSLILKIPPSQNGAEVCRANVYV